MTRYLVLDIESEVDDKRLVDTERSQLQYPLEDATLEGFRERITKQVCAEKPECFWPLRYHVPRVVSLLLVDENLNHIQSGHIAHAEDWQGVTTQFWDIYRQLHGSGGTTLVTFNGGGFDLPVLETSGLALGMDLSWYIGPWDAKPWQTLRLGRWGVSAAHLDLARIVGGGQSGGGLSFWARLFGLPGKLETSGGDVAGMLRARGLDAVKAYCACDVANTYGVFRQVCAAQAGTGLRALDQGFLDTVARHLDGLGPEAAHYMETCRNALRADGLF